MATRVMLYQRLNKTGGYAFVPVEYSRNGSPIAHRNATSFYLRYRADGKRHCVPAGANVLEADAQRKVLEARLLKGVQVTTPLADKTDRKRLAIEAEDYIERSKQKARKTYNGYKNAVNLFLASCKKTYLDEITRDDMLDFKACLAGRGDGASTIFNTFLKVVVFLNDRGIGECVKKENWIRRKDWPPNVDKKNKNKKYAVYSEDEFAAMLSVADVTECALLYFVAGSGLRIGEAAVAQWSDVDWDAKTVTVREKPELKFTPKDYEQRTIELADSVLDALEAIRGDAPHEGLIFPAPEGGVDRHLEDRVIVPIIERANAQGFKAKRPKKPAHALRVLFACRLCQAGVDIETIRVYLGHSDISTTQIYLRSADKQSDTHRKRINDAMQFHPATKLRIAS